MNRLTHGPGCVKPPTIWARDCNFRQVTSEQYRQEMVRDALINGFSFHGIRQRLLENRNLNLENAVEKPRSMELAQKNSEFYSLNHDYSFNLTATVADNSSTFSTTDNVSEATSSVSKLCTFFGRSIHARSMCPAKNAICFKCQRRGCFANVCKSKVF